MFNRTPYTIVISDLGLLLVDEFGSSDLTLPTTPIPYVLFSPSQMEYVGYTMISNSLHAK